jgi:hypothetical protein
VSLRSEASITYKVKASTPRVIDQGSRAFWFLVYRLRPLRLLAEGFTKMRSCGADLTRFHSF